ncbi:hypothetical protein BC941DRAFT_444587 [Chlamydoabsidia padenii]|nr:hypothetical protein BC941DRAFT_444587 [Chlamydoabsidia padenii]
MALFCPTKIGIWIRIWGTFFPSSSLNPDDLWLFLTSLHLPPCHLCSPPTLIFQVVGTTLQAIWRARWRLHFDNVPFLASAICNQVILDMNKLLPSLHTSVYYA